MDESRKPRGYGKWTKNRGNGPHPCDDAGKQEIATDASFIFEEIRGDLFKCPEDASLAHCVSRYKTMEKFTNIS
jgi:hypothetical protein